MGIYQSVLTGSILLVEKRLVRTLLGSMVILILINVIDYVWQQIRRR